MPAEVIVLVLLAALMHASWNALVKASPSKFLDVVAINGTSGVIAAIALPLLPAIDWACWPWLAASVLLHLVYFAAVVGAYRFGDLSQAYPIMRGCAPMLVAVMGVLLLGEQLAATMWAGVALIVLGIIGPALIAARGIRLPGRGTAVAAANAVVIACYTLVDGVGTRASGNAAGYGMWLFLLIAVPMTAFAAAWRGRELAGYLRQRWIFAALGGTLLMGSYLIVLWAMTRAPVAVVAALRETSVILAAIIGTVFLKERFGGWRIPGAALVAAGIAALNL
jgi:drug/metabolite transporter (DMT)-like permease